MEDHPSNRFVDLSDQNVTRHHIEKSPLASAIKVLLKLLSVNVEVFANSAFGHFYINPIYLVWSVLRTSLAPAVFSLTLIGSVYLIYFHYDLLFAIVPVLALTLCLMFMHTLIEVVARRSGIKLNNQAQGTPNIFFVLRHQFLLSSWFYYLIHPLIWFGVAISLFQLSPLFAPYIVFAGAFLVRNLMIGVGNYYYVDSVIDEEIKSRNVNERMKERSYKNTQWRKEESGSDEEDEFASGGKRDSKK